MNSTRCLTVPSSSITGMDSSEKFVLHDPYFSSVTLGSLAPAISFPFPFCNENTMITYTAYNIS
jgi:hypothetical protein